MEHDQYWVDETKHWDREYMAHREDALFYGDVRKFTIDTDANRRVWAEGEQVRKLQEKFVNEIYEAADRNGVDRSTIHDVAIETNEDKETFVRFKGSVNVNAEPEEKVWIEVSAEEAAERVNIERANEYQANFEALERGLNKHVWNPDSPILGNKKESPPTEWAIVCDLTGRIIGMAGSYEEAYQSAEAHLKTYNLKLLAGLREEADGLRERGKDNAGRFYTAMAEKEVYLEVYQFEAEHNYTLDKNGVMRVGRQN
jgi:hypothetical protein